MCGVSGSHKWQDPDSNPRCPCYAVPDALPKRSSVSHPSGEPHGLAWSKVRFTVSPPRSTLVSFPLT